MASAIEQLRKRLAEIHDLGRAAALLAWDERTMMPPAAGPTRSQQQGSMAAVRHRMFVDDEIGELIEAARAEVGEAAGAEVGESPGGAAEETDDQALVRIVARDWRKARLVPEELRAEITVASSVAEQAWVEARANSDFGALLPHLERNVELARRYAGCYEGFEDFSSTYDALLDEFEPGMRTAEMQRLLADLREGLVPLVAEVAASGVTVDDSCLRGPFEEEPQRRLVTELVSELPLPEGAWRLDPTVHPFAISIGERDVRLTTRYEADWLPSAIFGTLHEAGHGMYEAGVDEALARTPLSKPRSLGVHESQSRMWENWVGRGRPYLGRLLPRLRETFPGAFDEVDLEQLHRAVNRVERSLIRVEADELTYNLHILIRFELELEIFEGDLALADLPEAWNARYRDYLGLEVPDDARGVLQDVHWPGGSFGYFPTYSLGNVIAGQLWEAASRDLGDLPGRIGAGDLEALGEWLREHVHRHGRKLSPAQILERAGCGELSVEPLLGHLRSRAEEIYAVA